MNYFNFNRYVETRLIASLHIDALNNFFLFSPLIWRVSEDPVVKKSRQYIYHAADTNSKKP
jgi:hypothetical protein